MAEVHVDPLTVERFRLRSWPQLCERFRREEPGRYLPADDVATPELRRELQHDGGHPLMPISCALHGELAIFRQSNWLQRAYPWEELIAWDADPARLCGGQAPRPGRHYVIAIPGLSPQFRQALLADGFDLGDPTKTLIAFWLPQAGPFGSLVFRELH